MTWAKLLASNNVTRQPASEYDFAGGVTDTDADGLLKTVQQFAIDAEAWIKARHPTLA
jgi:hypothetical protein